jgi:hypothetical protein
MIVFHAKNGQKITKNENFGKIVEKFFKKNIGNTGNTRGALKILALNNIVNNIIFVLNTSVKNIKSFIYSYFKSFILNFLLVIYKFNCI